MRGDAGGDGKDADLCQHCGGQRPASRGGRPRKYCSSLCSGRAFVERNRTPGVDYSRCIDCGGSIPLRSGRGRRSRRCLPCKKHREAAQRRTAVGSCLRCGIAFEYRKTDRFERKFCSERCRWAGSKTGNHAEKIACQGCGKEFIPRVATAKHCSRECGNSAQVYRCLNCNVTFTRRRYASGAYSVQKKYCTRECAFEARRRRLPAAMDTRRKDGLTNSLAGWFLSWGDDVWPIARKCERCENTIVQREEAVVSSVCAECKAAKPCKFCGSPRQPYLKYCEACCRIGEHERRATRKEKRRLHRKKHRKKYGRNHRQRCRRFGVPYTPIKTIAVYELAGWRCQICGCELSRKWNPSDPRARTIDHIIPLSAGPGSPGHVLSNVQAACLACNTRKADSFAPPSARSIH